jgi:hypothetical protein
MVLDTQHIILIISALALLGLQIYIAVTVTQTANEIDVVYNDARQVEMAYNQLKAAVEDAVRTGAWKKFIPNMPMPPNMPPQQPVSQ